MGLTDLVQTVANALAEIPNGGTVAIGLPPQLGNQRAILVYPVPGDAVMAQHRGRGGSPVYQAPDSIIVERHVVIAKNDGTAGNADSMPVLDAMRDALWAISTPPVVVAAVRTDHYGFGTYAGVDTFVIRLKVELTHFREASA